MNSILQAQHASFSRKERGLTLVEILVAMVISLFLTAGVIQLFIGTKQTYRFNDGLSRIQENARFALETMAADIRMAAYSQQPPNPLPANYPPLPPSPFTTAVQGPANNDIRVRWFDPCPGAGPCPANSNQCDPAPGPGGVNGICFRRYFVQQGTAAAAGNPPACNAAQNSLFLQRDNAANAQELIEGVQALQILYGEDTTVPPDGTADQYVNGAAVANWNNIVSVRIDLLLVSLQDNIVTPIPGNSQQGQQTVFFPIYNPNPLPPANDRCLRQAFSTTITIRNRIP